MITQAFSIGGHVCTVQNVTLTRIYNPYNPLNLPPNTIRIKFSANFTPTMGDSQTLVDANENIWDIYKSSNKWSALFADVPYVLEVLGANLTTVDLVDGLFMRCHALTKVNVMYTPMITNALAMFNACTTLQSIEVFDTSTVENMNLICLDCHALKQVPLFNTSNVVEMQQAFAYCYAVETGALALYQQASTQTSPPINYIDTFEDCGRDTVNGAAELAQIPNDWK